MATSRLERAGIADLDDFTTDDLAEGLTNLYFTNERVDDRVDALIVDGAGIQTAYDDGANSLTIASTITQYTDELARDAIGTALTAGEGIDITVNDGADTITVDGEDATTANKGIASFNSSHFSVSSGAVSLNADTSDIPEGANLYFTDERAQDAVGTIFADSTSVDFTYTDGTPEITGDVPLYYRKASSPPDPLPWRVIVDEGTTNRLTNPRFVTDLTDWSEHEPTGGVTLTRETTGTMIGAGVGKVVVNTAGSGGIGIQTGTYATSGTTQEIATVWLKGNAGGEALTLRLVGDVSGAATENVTLTTSWKRVQIAKTPASDTTFRIRIVTTGATTPTFFVGAAQLERKSGTHGTAYWDATMGVTASSTRAAGLHHLGTIADNSGAPFQIGSDGAFVSSGQMVFRGERNPSFQVLGEFAHFFFTGAAFTSTTTLGDEVGVLKVRNEVNGNCLYVDADNVTTQFGQVISAGGLTSGAALVLAIPSDLSSFTGDFFSFSSKSGIVLGRLTKEKFKWGGDNEYRPKWIEGWGGGKFSNATTAKTGTISSSGVNVTGSGTNFDPEFAVGDLIVASGQVRRVATRASDTALTTNTAFSPSITAGTSIARADDQFEPFMYIAERSTSTLTDGTGDHYHSAIGAPLSGLFVGADGRWRSIRGTVNETVPNPTTDTDGQPIIQLVGKSSATTAVATTDETTIFSATVPGGMMGSTGILRCKITGNILRNGTDTFVLRVKLGSTTLITTGSLTTTNSASAQAFVMEIELSNMDSDAATQASMLEFWTTTTIATPYPANHVLLRGTATEDTTSDKTFAVTVDWSATDAGSIFTKEVATLEVM